MADWADLKTTIQNEIQANGTEDITGPVLQAVLLSMVNNLGENSTFAGFTIPTAPAPTPAGPIFLLGVVPGTYSNLVPGAVVRQGNVGIFIYSGSAWSFQNIPIDLAAMLKNKTFLSVEDLDIISADEAKIIEMLSYFYLNPTDGAVYQITDFVYTAATKTVTVKDETDPLNFHTFTLVETRDGLAKCSFKNSAVEAEICINVTALSGADLNYSGGSNIVVRNSNAVAEFDNARRLSDIETYNNEAKEITSPELTDGAYVDYNNGSTFVNVNLSATGFLDCRMAKKIDVSIVANSVYPNAGIAFYDKNKNFISGERAPERGTTATALASYEVPLNAFYFRSSWVDSTHPDYGDLDIFLRYRNYENLKEITFSENFLIDEVKILTADGTVGTDTDLASTGFIDCGGAEKINFRLLKTAVATDAGICFYDASKQFLYSIPAEQDTVNGFVNKTIYLSGDVQYCKVSYWNTQTRQINGEFYMVLVYDARGDYKEGQSEFIQFQVPVNQNFPGLTTAEALDDSENLKYPAGVLSLPDSYSSEGDATKLIVAFHDLKGGVSYDTWQRNETDWATRIAELNNAGFAVLDVNGSRRTTVADWSLGGDNVLPTIGSPVAVEGYSKAVDFALANYNLDKEINLLGLGYGALTALSYYMQKGGRSIFLLNAQVNTETVFNGTYSADIQPYFVELFDFASSSVYSEDKVFGYDITRRVFTVDGSSRLLENMPAVRSVFFENDTPGFTQVENLKTALDRSGQKQSFRGAVSATSPDLTYGADAWVFTEIAYWFNRS